MLERARTWLLDPVEGDGLAGTALRLLLALAFIPAGLGKFVNHDAYVERFERWDLPAPEVTPYLVGTVEVLGGTLLLLGVLVRPAALLLACAMLGALASAGRSDGGGFNVWAPILLLALLAAVCVTGAGRLRLRRVSAAAS